MSDQIQFTGVALKSFSRNVKGGSAHFVANLTAKVIAKMGWSEYPDGASSVMLDGSLAASTVQIKPAAGELAKWSQDIEASGVKGFEAIRYELQGKKNKGFRYELHFVITFADMRGCSKLEAFLTHVGDEKATLSVSYTKAAEQIDLVDDSRQATILDAD
jgi:hypothetical protein